MDDLRLVVDRAKGRPAVVVYTIVEPELREAMRDFCRRAKLHYCDILGPPLASIAKISGQAAKMAPGVRHPLDSAYFRRIGAIEFAVKYDDGIGGGLREADIVLVGVSRTSKTPLSMYLGYMGYKTANVPVVQRDRARRDALRDRPEQDRRADDRRNAARRDPAGARAADAGEPRRRTRELVEIYDELEQANAIHRRLGCPVLDITELSIEETASRVVKLVEQRKASAGVKEKPPIPLWRWVFWALEHGAGDCSSSTSCSRRSGSGCGRSRGRRSSGRGADARHEPRRSGVSTPGSTRYRSPMPVPGHLRTMSPVHTSPGGPDVCCHAGSAAAS